jgi:hypothetical protein
MAKTGKITKTATEQKQNHLRRRIIYVIDLYRYACVQVACNGEKGNRYEPRRPGHCKPAVGVYHPLPYKDSGGYRCAA